MSSICKASINTFSYANKFKPSVFLPNFFVKFFLLLLRNLLLKNIGFD